MDPSILLLLVTVGLLVMLFASRRRQQRDQQLMQSQLVVGCEVMTASGMFATVAAIEDDAVVLETAPGQTSRWDRRAVARVLSAPGDEAAEASDEDDEENPEDGAVAGGAITTDDIAAPRDDDGRTKES